MQKGQKGKGVHEEYILEYQRREENIIIRGVGEIWFSDRYIQTVDAKYTRYLRESIQYVVAT
jgi:hypothetical protein